MGYFQEWNDRLNGEADPQAINGFMEQYYALETEAYDRILKAYPEPFSGPAAELAEQLGFGSEMVVFAGFLDGIQTSLVTPFELEGLTDKTPVRLDIDFEKLLWNMHEAKADWLVGLDSWNGVLPEERRREIGKENRLSHIAVRDRPGRNDPCPCGSGKKFKNCCGK
mgnify:CR=1 FL=1